jgi:zinc protease
VTIICPKQAIKTTPQATVKTLENGITLIHQYVPSVSVAAVDIWIHAGTSNEPEHWLGMAHFLEHMIFKGTERILPGEFDWFIESQGGITNAATSHDYAHYNFTTAVQNFAPTLEHMAEMLLNASIPDDEFEQERMVVIEEIRQALDDPDWLSFQNLMQTAYPDHPYSRSVLGTEDVLCGFTPEHMRQFHRHCYRPEFMTVAVVGAVPIDSALAAVRQSFTAGAEGSDLTESGLRAGSSNMLVPGNNGNNIDRPQINGMCRCEQQHPRLQHSRLTMAWHGPSVDDLNDALGLELISVVLAEGRSSRLVQELREELGWVHDVGSGFAIQKAPGLFSISAYLDAEYLEPVEHSIAQHILRLSHEPIAAAEIDRAKRSLRNSFAFALESPNQLANFLGYHGLLGCYDLCADWSSAYSKAVSSFSALDLQQLAHKYLSPQQYILSSLVPES